MKEAKIMPKQPRKKPQGKFCAYIVKCADDTFYIGSTNNIERRVKEHNFSKRGARYTHQRRPVTLLYYEQCATLSDARKREYVLKQLSRKEKLALVM